jgi:hypothetical protein
VFYDGSHGSNLKLLKIRGLMDVSITKVREITKISNLLERNVRVRDAMQS